MDNFLLALKSVGHSMRIVFMGIARHDATWGFLTGFLSATGLYAIVVSEDPRALPTMLANTAPDSFNRLAPRGPDGTFLVSYTRFQAQYDKIRMAFYLALFAFLAVVTVAMLRY